MVTYYDYIIVGGGPSGLSMCQLLLKTGKSVLLLEGENSLGGCHRVARVRGKFTEHAPRIYSSAYTNLSALFQDMGFTFDDVFTRYNFTITSIGSKSIKSMQFNELFHFFTAFLNLVLDPDYGQNTTMSFFMKQHHFTRESQDYIDRLCRLVDGGTSSNSSLNQFLSIFNQQALRKLYQPRCPNDSEMGFVTRWYNFLTHFSNVTIKLNSRLTQVLPRENKIIINSEDGYYYKRLVLAISPYNIQELLPIYPSEYISNTKYIDYISIAFYWKDRVDLPPVYGFSNSDWGLVYIILSDYFKPERGTLITTVITILDKPSKRTGLTANQTVDLVALKHEIKLQLFDALKSPTPIPEPSSITLYPELSYNSKLKGWCNRDTVSFFKACGEPYIPNQVGNYKGIFNVGYQNGHHTYNFNSIEAAVSNGIFLASALEPGLDVPVSKPLTTVVDLVYYTLLGVYLASILIAFKYNVTSPAYYIFLIFFTLIFCSRVKMNLQ